MKNIAIILAGGVGTRLGGEHPKQFLEINGRMVIEHTIDAFEQNKAIDEIAVVMNPDYIAEMQEIVKRNSWTKLHKILRGGAERYYSTLAAIKAYNDECNMVFHDAVRPLVSQSIINRVLEALKGHDAVGVAVPMTDTIWQTNDKYIKAIPERSEMRRAQTPQAFRLSVIAEAYRRGLHDPAMRSTDDCGMVLHYMPDIPIYIVEGEQRNIKLTYKEDIPYIERLMNI